MLGYVKGYDIRGISLKKAEKDIFSDTLAASGVPESLKEQIVSLLKANGAVYAWYKKKTIVAVYLVERIENYLPEVKEKKMEGKEGTEINGHKSLAGLRITEAFVNDIAADVKPEFYECVLAEVRERVLFSTDEKAIEWNGKFQYLRRVKSGGLSMPLYLIPLILGFVFGILNNHMTSGLMFGLTFGILFALFGFGKESAWEELDATEVNKIKASEIIKPSVLEE